MSTILKLVQGTAEWLAHRKRFRNASETPAVLGLSPFQTPYQLWLSKTGRKQQEVTPAMARGTELEPAARAAYERLTGQIMEPLVLVDGEYGASLDGITLEGDLILEIKCPYKGRDSQLWQAAAGGELPEAIWWQVQHQLMVAGAALAQVFVFDGREGLMVEARPDLESWFRIRSAWQEFMAFITSDTPPPLTDKDCRLREDAEWQQLAAAYVRAKQVHEAASLEVDGTRERLLAATEHSSESGSGVTVTRFSKVGAVDYKKIPELKGVNLEQYRGASRQEARITIAS